MTQKIKFGDIERGQEFTLGSAKYRKVDPRPEGSPCRGCGEQPRNAIRLDDNHKYTHFCLSDIVTVPTITIEISDDLALEIHTGHPRYKFIRLTSKAGSEATDDEPGFLDITQEEIPALIRALIKTQSCLVCALGEIAEGYLHDEDCSKYIPF